jgi:hypothetical protein
MCSTLLLPDPNERATCPNHRYHGRPTAAESILAAESTVDTTTCAATSTAADPRLATGKPATAAVATMP